MGKLFYYQCPTKAGPVSLIPEASGRYKIVFRDENLGSYHSAQAAASDASGGHTFSPSGGIDLGDLGLPEDLGEWNRLPFAEINWGDS